MSSPFNCLVCGVRHNRTPECWRDTVEIVFANEDRLKLHPRNVMTMAYAIDVLFKENNTLIREMAGIVVDEQRRVGKYYLTSSEIKAVLTH